MNELDTTDLSAASPSLLVTRALDEGSLDY
ncbi:MAG: hypothetical protein JWP66_1992 [Naasia sp.]|nr:hypothetical protein [Naasia sp.]